MPSEGYLYFVDLLMQAVKFYSDQRAILSFQNDFATLCFLSFFPPFFTPFFFFACFTGNSYYPFSILIPFSQVVVWSGRDADYNDWVKPWIAVPSVSVLLPVFLWFLSLHCKPTLLCASCYRKPIFNNYRAVLSNMIATSHIWWLFKFKSIRIK